MGSAVSTLVDGLEGPQACVEGLRLWDVPAAKLASGSVRHRPLLLCSVSPGCRALSCARWRERAARAGTVGVSVPAQASCSPAGPRDLGANQKAPAY